jgi:hypothetical protein
VDTSYSVQGKTKSRQVDISTDNKNVITEIKDYNDLKMTRSTYCNL